MSLVRLSQICLALGLMSFLALSGVSFFLLDRLHKEQQQLAFLLQVQREVSAISVGADAIALSGTDQKLYEAFVAKARRLQTDLKSLSNEFPDARNAVKAIDMILTDLDPLVPRDRADYLGPFARANADDYFSKLADSNIASHGIALDAAVSEALKQRQEQIADRAFWVAASFASVASFFLFATVGSFALIYQRIGGPLRAFARTIKAIDQGQPDARAPDTADDEIGEVGRAFNELIKHRRAAEEELERSASLLRIAGQMAQFGGWRYDAVKREIEWSDETALIHGEPPGTQPSLEDGLNYYVEEDRARIAKLFGDCVEKGQPFDDIFRICNANGNVVWIRSAGQPVYGGDGTINGAHGAFQDVSDLMAARSEAERRDAELQDVINSIGDGFMILDQEWHFRYANSTALRLMERSDSDLIGRNIWEEFPEAVGTDFEHYYNSVLETGQSQSFVAYFAPLEKWFEVSAHATREGLAVYFRDYTDEYERQSQLRLLQAAIDRIDDIILITEAEPISGPDHPRTVYANAAFERRTGYSREEALATTPRILQGPETDRSELDRIRAALIALKPVRAELVNYTKSGEPFWLELEISPVADETGSYTHWISVERDITERKEIERQLRESQKMEAVGHLTGGVAHDFNNLLTVILGNAELISEMASDPKIRQMAEVTMSAAERGAQLTGRLLAFARRKPLDPRLTDLNQLIESMQPLIRRTVPESTEIECVLDPELGIAEIDAGELDTALLNLIVNARDAMEDGGKITIETANVVLDDHYAARHSEVEPGEHIMVCVSDTGKGMDPETLRQAFEPFFTTKDVGKGSGLGLSMVFGFTKQSGGHIKIYSEPNEGTSVKLYFPRLPIEQETDVKPAVEVPLTGGTEHILIAEDDDLVLQHLKNQLVSLGYRVSEAMSGPEALEVMQTHEDIDLLLTDIVMPGGMNGRELAEQAQSARPSLKVLFTSGYTENAIVHQGRLDPGVALLSKPYTRLELATKVRRVLDGDHAQFTQNAIPPLE
ncbi:PAS domain S-box protein [Lutimaribacter sp. EGI FJ00015]|uniref:PAS domain S-box protein n=1 Tax=Lutimaribacter degradans TaxID=2945989 RepID=A0ACC5ZZQ2_9RHOB|nr:PAS domain S-box protein [Lutimaribacter sp. EGI FJ00013]MCM2563668.1 PAS domain S-box protein [Lutimaribacter sp. EGI FJ00013]MCO0614851.1 PAS domain S-box protein [Lutimaribacter sp. EGI FJ00015]MCO0637520.1 PAS domain S-box protein [Lutimaribacter sp. EGI FJ00014]